MTRSVSTFLMFFDVAEQALDSYVAIFAHAVRGPIVRWAAGEPGKQGTIKRAELSIDGHQLILFDSPAKHAFTFTPATSLFVECESEAEQEAAYAKLSDGGQIMMALANHGFSKKFAWVNDRFGVSWQLNLA